MNTYRKAKLVRKQQYIKVKLISNISKCLENAVRKKNSESLKSKLTTAVTRSIKNFESSTQVSDSNRKAYGTMVTDTVITSEFHNSNPEIEILERTRNRLRRELRAKQNDFENLTRRTQVTKELTRNDAIAGVVGNIIKKFKTLSKEKQLLLVNDKALLARNVEKYIKEVIVFYDTQERQWGITFKKNNNLLDSVSTGKDVVVLAINLSSKYVHLATSSIYGATRLQLTLCRKERDELKDKLAKVEIELQTAYLKEGSLLGFKGGFGGGTFSGGGATGQWNY